MIIPVMSAYRIFTPADCGMAIKSLDKMIRKGGRAMMRYRLKNTGVTKVLMIKAVESGVIKATI